jgi:PDZ domain-containing secreted protein
MADEKPDGKPDEMTDAARLRDWMDSVGGNVYPGSSTLKSVKESKDGDKITIVLKRQKEKKQKKKSDQA